MEEATPASAAPDVHTRALARAAAPLNAKRRARGKNFHAHEDLRLCASWLHVSEHDAQGSAPLEEDGEKDTTTSFWERVCAHFNAGNANGGDDVAATSVASEDAMFRSYQSLQSRWSALQATLAKFGDIYSHVQQEKLREAQDANSGDSTLLGADAKTHDELLKVAHTRYVEQHSKQTPFASQPCWEFLKSTQCWKLYVNRKGKGRVRRQSRQGMDDLDPQPRKEATSGSEKDDGEAEKQKAGALEPEARREVSLPVNMVSKQPPAKRRRSSGVAAASASTHSEQETTPAVPQEDAVQTPASQPTQPSEPVVVAPVAPPSPSVYGFLSLFAPPLAFSEDEQMLQWTIRENRTRVENALSEVQQEAAPSAVFAVFDDNRRIEVLEGGVYQLNLYLEPQGKDDSKYYLEINGTPFEAFRASSATNGPTQVDSGLQSQDIPLKAANVAKVCLNKWDMLALRRKADPSSTDATGPAASMQRGRTPFGRLIIETAREMNSS